MKEIVKNITDTVTDGLDTLKNSVGNTIVVFGSIILGCAVIIYEKIKSNKENK